LRADDLLSLQFDFINLQVSTLSPGQPVLTIVNPANPAFIVVTFPPQNIAEQAFWLDDHRLHVPPGQPPEPGGTESPTSPVVSRNVRRIANASHLVFTVPSNAAPIPYNLPSLIEKCSEFAPSIARTAVAPPLIFPILHIHLAAAEMLQAAVAAPVTAATGPAAPAPRPAALPLAGLMVQHRAMLQAWRSLTFKIAAGAAAASNLPRVALGPWPLVPPAFTDTAIEIPYRLILSPNQYGAWAHASRPVSSQVGRTELWHTRLGSRLTAGAPIDENAGTQYYFRNLSAIWARDPAITGNAPPAHGLIPFRTSLDAFDRWNIVHQSYDHADIITNRMMLTTLGGWLDVRGTWDDRDSTIKEWRHVVTMGRDHYARIVYPGFLFPFGHRASLCKITERLFHPSLPGNPAYLRQRVFVVVREHDKFYHQNAPGLTDTSGSRFDLQMPFQRVRITTMVTPNLDEPASPDTPSCFCPRVGGVDFKFHLVAEDLDGNEIEFSAPLHFVDASPLGDVAPGRIPDHLDNLMVNYPTLRGVCDFQGRRVVFAEGSDPHKPSDIKPGSTSFETTSVTFSATRLDDAHKSALAWECHFYPKVVAANIIVPALKHLAGNARPVRVHYDDAVYLRHGFDPGQNKGQVFLKMASPADPSGAVHFSGQGDRSGGLVTPNMQMTALSRLLGPVAGNAATVSGGNFDPQDFFAALGGALLFGTIPLTEVLQAVGLDDPSKLPRFVTEGMSKLDGLLQDVAAAAALVTTVSAGIDSAAAALGAKATVLKAAATALAADLDALTTDLQGLVKEPKSTAQGFVHHLETFVGDLQKFLDDLPPLDVVADAKRTLRQILSRFQQEVALAESIIDTLLAEQLTIKFMWNPVIQSWPAGNPLFVPNQPDGFKISVEMQVAKSAAEPAMDIYCGIRDFKLQLIPILGPFVTLHFDVLEFTVSTGKSPDVNVKLDPNDGITFDGCLSFVNTLEKLIPFDGFSDPPALSVTPAGISAGYSMGLPTVGIGAFSLQNISFGAGFTVPFVVNPLELDFNFCTREQPFLLTVSLFGGGGYFLMKARPKDIYRSSENELEIQGWRP
jgi:hypothetical protein